MSLSNCCPDTNISIQILSWLSDLTEEGKEERRTRKTNSWKSSYLTPLCAFRYYCLLIRVLNLLVVCFVWLLPTEEQVSERHHRRQSALEFMEFMNDDDRGEMREIPSLSSQCASSSTEGCKSSLQWFLKHGDSPPKPGLQPVRPGMTRDMSNPDFSLSPEDDSDDSFAEHEMQSMAITTAALSSTWMSSRRASYTSCVRLWKKVDCMKHGSKSQMNDE